MCVNKMVKSTSYIFVGYFYRFFVSIRNIHLFAQNFHWSLKDRSNNPITRIFTPFFSMIKWGCFGKKFMRPFLIPIGGDDGIIHFCQHFLVSIDTQNQIHDFPMPSRPDSIRLTPLQPPLLWSVHLSLSLEKHLRDEEQCIVVLSIMIQVSA